MRLAILVPTDCHAQSIAEKWKDGAKSHISPSVTFVSGKRRVIDCGARLIGSLVASDSDKRFFPKLAMDQSLCPKRSFG